MEVFLLQAKDRLLEPEIVKGWHVTIFLQTLVSLSKRPAQTEGQQIDRMVLQQEIPQLRYKTSGLIYGRL